MADTGILDCNGDAANGLDGQLYSRSPKIVTVFRIKYVRPLVRHERQKPLAIIPVNGKCFRSQV